MTNMERKASIQVAEVAVVELTSALTSSQEDVEEDLASSRLTTFSDSSSEVEIHLLISLTMTMIPSRRSAAEDERRINQTNREEEGSKPLAQWVEVSSMMTTSLVGDSEAASEAGQCSNRCNHLVEVEDINKCSSQALVEWEWAAAWANLCQHKPTSRMASVSLALKQAQSMLKAIDQLKLKKRLMMVVVT